jgi:hypothetical protein
VNRRAAVFATRPLPAGDLRTGSGGASATPAELAYSKHFLAAQGLGTVFIALQATGRG